MDDGDLSYQDYFFEICWLVEAGRTGEGGLPGKVLGRFFCGVINAEQIDFVPCFWPSSTNHI